MKLLTIPVLLLLLAGRPPAAQEPGLAELARTISLANGGEGFTKKLTGIVTNARVKSLALNLDWWTGPGDDRVGEPAKAVKAGFRFEVRHGADWIELPPVTRDLDLTGRTEAPRGTLAGEPVGGLWAVRQTAGDEPVQRVEVLVTYLVPAGKGINQPDLVVAGVRFTELEADPVPEGRFPLRRDYPVLLAGKEHPARVIVRNAGYGDAREPEVALWLVPIEGKGRTNLPSAGTDVVLREGEEMGIRWALPLPAKLAAGLYRLVAEVDPGGRVNEMNEENNLFSRVIRVAAPE
jgi:hypothetical protein